MQELTILQMENMQKRKKLQQEDMLMGYTMQMGNQRIGGMMMEQIGSSSKTVRNLQDMEKIMQELTIL